jgi:uncharacterized protein YigE (DUF2233 family)
MFTNLKTVSVHFIFLLLSATFFLSFSTARLEYVDEKILSYTADPQKENIELYWKDDKGEIIGSLGRLRKLVESKNRQLVFAMNAGMYLKDRSPQGLFIQHSQLIKKTDTGSGSGNFHLKPNGIFYIREDNVAVVCQTSEYPGHRNVKFATQSGPMLLVNGQIHPAFREGSVNLNIRNGAGILPDGKILFAMSEKEINFWDFAMFFKNKGCRNALYLDGFVSRTYYPAGKWVQTDGNFGVMIGVTGK